MFKKFYEFTSMSFDYLKFERKRKTFIFETLLPVDRTEQVKPLHEHKYQCVCHM